MDIVYFKNGGLVFIENKTNLINKIEMNHHTLHT